MKLFYSTASPYARTTQVTLREVGLLAAEHEVETHPFNNEAEFISANPLGKVPCLVLDNGETLFDSEVICQYLDQTFNRAELWNSIAENWIRRKIYSLVSGLLDISVALRQEKMREDEGLKSEFWWGRFNSGLSRGLKELDFHISQFPETFSLLHINTVCLLDYLTFRHAEISWRRYDNLDVLYNNYSNREAFQQTLPRA